MSFLGSPFDHDLFVSYAHGPGGNLRHWSHCLVEQLERDILDLEVEFDELRIFLDKDLDPAKALTEQLRGKVQASGLLLVIMSNRYLQSAWCKDELEWFENELKACQDGGGVVLVVRAQPTDHDAWPACLKDERGHVVLGFPFHPDNRNGEGLIHPYGWPEPLPSDRPYYQELARLSTIVIKRLREIKERRELEASSQRPSVQISIQGEPKIYLQAAGDRESDWQRTKEIMETAGCKVLPEALPSIGGDLKAIQTARKQRIRLLNDDAHALCLLGSHGADGLHREIDTIISDRIALEAIGKQVPFALLHQGDDSLALAKEFGIDAIDAAGDDWLIRFQGWLQHALTAETVS